MIKLLLSTLRLSLRWGIWWLRSRATLWLVSMARYKLQSLKVGLISMARYKLTSLKTN